MCSCANRCPGVTTDPARLSISHTMSSPPLFVSGSPSINFTVWHVCRFDGRRPGTITGPARLSPVYSRAVVPHLKRYALHPQDVPVRGALHPRQQGLPCRWGHPLGLLYSRAAGCLWVSTLSIHLMTHALASPDSHGFYQCIDKDKSCGAE